MHLNLFLIDFPITALTSIIHRITGIICFYLYLFSYIFFIYLLNHIVLLL
ncbi:MAG TPA: hypothetical protein ACYCC8_01130 [Candidatus Azoamicus sp.]